MFEAFVLLLRTDVQIELEYARTGFGGQFLEVVNEALAVIYRGLLL